MPSSAASGPPHDELDEALEEFVWEYRRGAAAMIGDFLDGRLNPGPERKGLEERTLKIFEESSEQIAAVLKRGLA
jgi:hypothetical protein